MWFQMNPHFPILLPPFISILPLGHIVFLISCYRPCTCLSVLIRKNMNHHEPSSHAVSRTYACTHDCDRELPGCLSWTFQRYTQPQIHSDFHTTLSLQMHSYDRSIGRSNRHSRKVLFTAHVLDSIIVRKNLPSDSCWVGPRSTVHLASPEMRCVSVPPLAPVSART